MQQNDYSKFQLSQEQKDFIEKTWGQDEIQILCHHLSNNLTKASIAHPEWQRSAELVSKIWGEYNLIKSKEWEKERDRLFKNSELV